MARTFRLGARYGLVLAEIDGRRWVIDTGSPGSFGDVRTIPSLDPTISLNERLSHGPTIREIEGFLVERPEQPLTGLLGAEVLNRFDVIFNLTAGEVSFGDSAAPGGRHSVRCDFCMGIPVIRASVAGSEVRLFFDTGAPHSYFSDELVDPAGRLGPVEDFYPGAGRFRATLHEVVVRVGTLSQSFRAGRVSDLPRGVATILQAAGVEGILGNEVLRDRVVGYLPRSQRIVFDEPQ
jgi:hypothetical protein